jgi:hypothetical protein
MGAKNKKMHTCIYIVCMVKKKVSTHFLHKHVNAGHPCMSASVSWALAQSAWHWSHQPQEAVQCHHYSTCPKRKRCAAYCLSSTQLHWYPLYGRPSTPYPAETKGLIPVVGAHFYILVGFSKEVMNKVPSTNTLFAEGTLFVHSFVKPTINITWYNVVKKNI